MRNKTWDISTKYSQFINFNISSWAFKIVSEEAQVEDETSVKKEDTDDEAKVNESKDDKTKNARDQANHKSGGDSSSYYNYGQKKILATNLGHPLIKKLLHRVEISSSYQKAKELTQIMSEMEKKKKWIKIR